MRDSNGDLTGTFEFRRAPIGAGGFITGMDQAFDGSFMVHWTDSWNGYIREPDDVDWTELFNTDTLDPEDQTSWADGTPVTDDGVYAVRVAPSNKNIIYASYYGWIWKSINRGAHFERTTFAAKEMESNAGHSRRFQYTVDVHPTDPNTVIVGTQNAGVYYTVDGGDTWTQITGLPAAAATFGIASKYMVIFDPITPNYVYVHVPGSGLWRSTTGVGGTFSLITGSSLTCSCLRIGQSGKVYLCQFRTSSTTVVDALKTSPRGSSTWTSVAGTSGFDQLAIDPFDENHLVAANENGTFYQTIDGGATWRGYSRAAYTVYRGSGEIGWYSNTYDQPMYVSMLKFDNVVEGKLWMTDGVSINYADCPGVGPTDQWVFHDWSQGNEQLIPSSIKSIPGLPNTLVFWDKPFWRMNHIHKWRNTFAYPVAAGNVFSLSFTDQGYNVDYAIDDPQFLVGVSGQSSNHDGYSTNGGQTYAELPNKPSGLFGGAVAVSTTLNWIRVGTNNGPAKYTKDGGATWANVALGGHDPVTHWINVYSTIRIPIAADKERPNVFAALVNNIVPQDYTGVTITIASPGVVTWPLHSLVNGNRVNFTTTGALPTGLTAGVNYYVINKTANTFQLSLTSGGAAINTSGSQSGVHSGHTAGDIVGRDNAGIWVTEDGGDTWDNRFNGCIQTAFGGGGGNTSQFYRCIFEYIPGFSGELLYADCNTSADNCLFWSDDDGETWVDVDPTIRNVLSAGMGKPAPGQTRPAVYFFGSVSGVRGFYVSLDWFATPPTLIALSPMDSLNYGLGGIGPTGGDINRFGLAFAGSAGNGAFVCEYAKRFTAIDTTEAAPAVPDGYDIILHFGDSLQGGVGYNNNGDMATYDRDVTDVDLAGAYQFTGPDAALAGGTASVISSDITPIWSNNSSSAEKLALSEFVARAYKGELAANRKSLVVNMARGGQALTNGVSTVNGTIAVGGTRYNEAIVQFNNAIATAKAEYPGSRIRAIVVSAGSNDANNAAGPLDLTVFQNALGDVITGIRTEVNEAAEALAFIFGPVPGPTGTDFNTVRTACLNLEGGMDNVDYIVPLDSGSDNLHPSRDALFAAGATIAALIPTLPEPELVAPFTISSESEVAVDSDINGDAFMVRGIGEGVPATLTVTGGKTSVNGGGYTTAAKTVYWGDMVSAQVHSSTDEGEQTQAVVTITGPGGGTNAKSATFTVTTEATGTEYTRMRSTSSPGFILTNDQARASSGAGIQEIS